MLIIETVTGLPDAESYASIAATGVHCASLGLIAWTGLREVESYATQSGVA